MNSIRKFRISLVAYLVILTSLISLTTLMYVFAARGVLVFNDFVISYISPTCFVVDGGDLNVALKSAAGTSASTYTQNDTKVQNIIFDYWTDSAYSSMFNWNTGSNTNVDRIAENANIRVFWKNNTKTLYVLSSSLIASDMCAHMFENFTALQSVDFRNFNSMQSISMESMFSGCTALTQILNSDKITTLCCTTTKNMFYNCSALTTLDTSGYKTNELLNMEAMFKGCSSLSTINLGDANISSVASFKEVFSGCSSLSSLTLPDTRTTSATTMQDMFKNCASLASIDTSNFHTAQVNNMSGMFSGCTLLGNIDLTTFDTANVTDFSAMFYNCSSITNLDLKNITVDNATNLSQMFAGCGTSTLDLSKFDTSLVTNMNQMFNNMSHITTISVSNMWTTTAVTNSTAMFTGSTNLVGGLGTTYNASYIDKTYAHIDLPPEKPGYFTACDIQYKGVYIYDEFNNLLNITYVGSESPYTLPNGDEWDYFKDTQNNTYHPNDTLLLSNFSAVESVNLTMYLKRYTITAANNSDNNGNRVNRTVSYTFNGQTTTLWNNTNTTGASSNKVPKGATVDISVSTSSTSYNNPRCEVTRTSGGTTVSLTTVTQYQAYRFTMPAEDVTITFGCTYGGFCVASGTMITLADGSQKTVEDITLNDELLIVNHETGEFDTEEINFIEYDGIKEYNVINLVFSNGQTSRIICEHAYFDMDLNKYVYIHEDDCTDYIGHHFYALKSTNPAEAEIVVLEDAFVTTEITGCYSLVTKYHLNYFIDNMLSIPGGIAGLFNIFEYGENLKYDEQDKQTAIEMYGLFTYEDFDGLLDPETFDLYPTKYLKVALNRGIITPEIMEYLIERYT